MFLKVVDISLDEVVEKEVVVDCGCHGDPWLLE